jgi:hypothetical protein
VTGLQKQSFKFKLHLPEMQVCHTLVEALCNPQCIGAHPKLKAGTIRNTTIQQAQYKNTTSATQEHKQTQHNNAETA